MDLVGKRVRIGFDFGTIKTVEKDSPLSVQMDEGPIYLRPSRYSLVTSEEEAAWREAHTTAGQ